MDKNNTRRGFLTVVGGTGATLAGCLDAIPGPQSDQTDSPAEADSDGDDPAGSDADGAAELGGTQIDDFEDLDNWAELEGEIDAETESPYQGSQAAHVVNEGTTAGIFTAFSDGLDIDGQHLSLALRVEEPAGLQLVVEVMAPAQSDHVVATRRLPADLADWFRVDLGYTNDRGEPGFESVQEIRIYLQTSDERAIQFWVDDLRSTSAIETGVVILAFYGALPSHYETVAPLLDDRGWAGVAAVAPQTLNAEGRLDIDQIRQMRDLGWDISSFPLRGDPFPEMSPEDQRNEIQQAHDYLNQRGFEDGARHFFAPYDRIDGETLDILQDVHETGFLFGASPTAVPPTGPHTISRIDGTDLEGTARLITLAEQYNQLVTLTLPSVGDDGEEMSTEEFEALLDFIEDRDVEVITPSQLLDEYDTETDDGDEDEQ